MSLELQYYTAIQLVNTGLQGLASNISTVYLARHVAGALENALTLSSLCMLPRGTRHADKKETACELQVMEYSTFCSPYLTPPQRKEDPSTLHLTLTPDLCLQHG